MTTPQATTSPFADEAPERYLTSLVGWRAFVDDQPVIPAVLSASKRASLTPDELHRYDEGRVDHHTRLLLVVATSTVQHTVTCGRRLVLLNRHAVSARRGLIVSGPAGTGKTTAITQLGRAHELLDRARHPGVSGRIPVVYITVPPAATARMVAVEFARFLGLPVRVRSNITDVLETVCGVLTDTRVGLVLIDEIHRLNPRTTSGAQAADLLKDLTERIGATFVYAGIDVTSTALFTGVRGAQLAGRASLVECGVFPARLGSSEPFRELVTAMENALDLRHHRTGSLVRLAPYLHERTTGRIGSLARLIRQAAITSLNDGTERITKTTLDQIPLDHLTEQHHRRAPRRPAPAP
ncbi:ATP-binding protein [Streptomyces sp. ISL-43]|uniref:TniB family NTP-binding protein n=1 Tax=Streptomyces sp. ISL-43 TaxID=2819183 RepID=UPI001BEC89C1|nr:TniB family NTP-binding protein [Streptomyces sp. ISL-43]MBT2453028.1 ATP-binding protein [Streptomyces sp. ISL-43]